MAMSLENSDCSSTLCVFVLAGIIVSTDFEFLIHFLWFFRQMSAVEKKMWFCVGDSFHKMFSSSFKTFCVRVVLLAIVLLNCSLFSFAVNNVFAHFFFALPINTAMGMSCEYDTFVLHISLSPLHCVVWNIFCGITCFSTAVYTWMADWKAVFPMADWKAVFPMADLKAVFLNGRMEGSIYLNGRSEGCFPYARIHSIVVQKENVLFNNTINTFLHCYTSRRTQYWQCWNQFLWLYQFLLWSSSCFVFMSDLSLYTMVSATLFLVSWHPLTEGDGIFKQLHSNRKLVELTDISVRPTYCVILGCAKCLLLVRVSISVSL